MTAVKWKEPLFTSIPVVSLILVTFLLVPSHSQWISYRRDGRHSNLWFPNKPASPRTLRHSIGSGSRSSSRDAGNRQIDHRSGSPSSSSSSHSNFYTINSSKDLHATASGAYHQYQQPRYSSQDYGSRSSSSSGKNVRISDIPSRGSSSSPTASSNQRNHHQFQHRDGHIPENVLNHRHLPVSGQHAKNKVTSGSQPPSKHGGGSYRSNSAAYDPARRQVTQQAGHLLDSWPNSNTHHHLAPVPPTAVSAKQFGGKNGFTNMKPEQWGNNVLISNKPIEIKAKTPKPTSYQNKHGYPQDKQASDRQLILPSGYPTKDKTAVTNTINTLTKLSPKKPIFVFMRKEGITAVKAGADAGDVIKKLAGTSKLPFYNGTTALPSHSMPTVFLAPEDMTEPSGYGKIPIPNLKPKSHTTPKPSYTKILMPGGTHMKGALIPTTSRTTPSSTISTTTEAPLLLGSPSSPFGVGLSPTGSSLQNLQHNNSVSSLSLEQKLHLLQLLRTQPNHPLANQAAIAILSASSAAPSASPSPSSPIPSQIVPQQIPGIGPFPVVQGPTLALPTQGPTAPQWAQQLFQQGVLPPGSVIEGISAQNQGYGPPTPGVVSSTTLPPLPGIPSSISPSGEPTPAGGEDIHKLIGTIVESAVSNTVSSMLQHQKIFQPGQPQLVGVGPPLHAANLPGAPTRPGPPPYPPHFGRGPPPPPQRPQGPPRLPFGFPQRVPFSPQPPTPGRFPPHPSVAPTPNPQQYPSPHPPNPSGPPPQQSPTGAPPPPQQYSPQYPTGAPPQPQFPPHLQYPTGAPPPSPPQQFPPHPQYPTGAPPPPQLQQQASYVRPVQLQHPIVPQFALPPGYPAPSSPQPSVSSTPPPGFLFNPSSTGAPPQFPQPHPNSIRQPPPQRKPNFVERPYPNKPRNPLHNALQFFGISTPRPDAQSPSPSPTPIVSSTPYPHPPFPPSATPFRGPPPPFPSSTPQPFPHSPFYQTQQGPSPIPQQPTQNDGKPKKPTLIVQTPNGPAGKKNTYVITGGGSELPELNKIMKVLNELHVDSENSPSTNQHQHQPAPSPSPTPVPSTTPYPPIFSSSMSPTPTPFSPTRGPSPFPHIPNVLIKNANVGISPTPLVSSTGSPQQFVSSTTPGSVSPTTPRPHIMSSTSIPLSNSSPVMQIIQQIQHQIPGVQVSPSVQTVVQRQNEHRPALVSPRPVSPTPAPAPSPSGPPPFLLSSPFPGISPTPGPIVFSSPRPSVSASPSPTPGQVVISSTGFPRVINVSPSASATPSSIHQAVVEAIMKQQAADHGGSPGQIVVTGGPGPSPSATPQFIEVIPANGAGGLGEDSSAKPFIVQIPPQQPSMVSSPILHNSLEPNEDFSGLPGINVHDPNIHIQRGSMESHETYTEKSKKQSVSSISMSSSVENSGERRRPVYSRERFGNNGKTHHHSKEVDVDYHDKHRHTSYNRHENHFEEDDHLNPNRRMYSGESSKQEIPSEEAAEKTKELSDEEKLIEKIITEEKIVWKQGPGQGELIPSKVRTEERIIIRPNSKEAVDSEFSQRRTPLSSAEHFLNLAKQPSTSLEMRGADKSSSSQGVPSKELGSDSPSNFAGILRSKMKFDRLMEKLYPSKQLVSPFTISNQSAGYGHHHRFHGSDEIVPTIASSMVTTPQHLSSAGPTLPPFMASTLSGLMSSVSPTADPGRFRIRPGDISHIPPEQQIIGVSPSGQPIFLHSSPSSPTADATMVNPSMVPSPSSSQQPSSSVPFSSMAPGTVEQRLIFIPQGTAASAPIKSNKPQILITTVDELPDLMAQLSGTNPEIRMVPDKATLEAELAKVAATSTLEVVTTRPTSASTTTQTTTTQPPPPPYQNNLFRGSPSPSILNNGIRRADGPEKAFTWRPAMNTTVTSPISATFDASRRIVSGLGAGMLHAMSNGFGNIGNINKFSWLGPSTVPQQHPPQLPPQGPTQMLYAMQNGVPVPLNIPQQQHKLPIAGPYQQVLLQSGVNGANKDILGGTNLGYYSYNLLPQQPPTMPTVPSTTPTKTPDYKLMYRSQYREDELPVPPKDDKVQPIGPVHKLKKGARVRVKTTSRTTSSPIDPVSAEEYEEDEDDVEQEDLIPHDALVPKHAGRGKVRQQEDDDNSGSYEDDNPRRRSDRPKPGNRRRRPGKLEDDDEEEDDDDNDDVRRKFNKNARSRVRPKKQGKVPNRGRSDVEGSDEEEDEEDDDYEVYDVKPAFHMDKRRRPASPTPTSPTLSTTTQRAKNKAIYVNREMFLVSGEERTKEGNPKAEPVYQPSQMPSLSKFPVLPSIISAQSVVKKLGPNANGTGEYPKPSTTQEPKPTSASTTSSTTTTSATTKLSTTKIAPTLAAKIGKRKDDGQDDYKETQDELKALLRKIQTRLTAQDEIYDFGEDSLYDYYDELQQAVQTTRATTTTTTTRGTPKPKKGKKNKKKKKKNKKKNKTRPRKNKTTQKMVTQKIPTRRPVSTTTQAATPKVFVHHHQRHPVSSLEQFTSSNEPPTTTTTSTTTTTTTTTTTPPPPPAQSIEEATSGEPAVRNSGSAQSGSLEAATSVSYVFSQNAKDNLAKMKRRPLWIRRKIAGASALGSSEGLQNVRVPNGPGGKVIRLVRRRRPMGGRRRLLQQQRQQLSQQQSFEQADKPQPVFPSTTTTTSTSTVSSIEVAPPNYSSPPLEQYFEQNSLERRVGNSGRSLDSTERANGTVTLRSPKRKLKLIRLKGQRAQWRLRLQGTGDEESSSEGGPRPAALIAPRQVSAPLPLQAPLPAPVFTSQGLHSSNPVVPSPSSSSVNTARAAKSASDMISHYTTSFSSESASSSVEAKVCVKGKCEIVSRQ